MYGMKENTIANGVPHLFFRLKKEAARRKKNPGGHFDRI